MTFYGDENVPPGLMNILRNYDPANAYIAFTDATFIQGAPDDAWMPKVLSKKDQAIISQDAQVLRNKAQHIVFKGAYGSYVCLGDPFGRLNYQAKIRALLQAWPSVLNTLLEDIAHDAQGVYLVKTTPPYIVKKHDMAALRAFQARPSPPSA